MKILYITPRFPYPLLKGDQVVVYHRLRILSRKHDITLLSFYENERDLDGIKYLKPYCSAIHTIKLPKWQSFINIAINAPFSQLPLQVLYYQSPVFKNCLRKLLQENKFDLIHASLLRVSEHLEGIQIPKIIDLIDSMQLNLQRRILLESPLKKMILSEELRRISNYECNIGKFFNHMIVVANNDKEVIPGDNVSVISNGVDTEYFSPKQDSSPTYNLIFSGNMGYEPNINAVKWFAEKCFPIIQDKIPNVTWCIAGGNPTPDIKKVGHNKNITVTGRVDSMPQFLNTASVAITPMQSGSGMQNKILEAMACALPVVTTSLGLGSIKAVHGKEVFIADTPEDFSQLVLQLLLQPQLASSMGNRARKYVEEYHSWERAAEMVEAIYCKVL